MKIQKNKKSNRNKIIVALILLGLAIVGVIYFAWSRQARDSPTATPTSTQKTDTKKESTSTSKLESGEEKSSTTQQAIQQSPEKEKDITPPYEGTNPNTAESLSGAITYSAVAGDKLIVRTNINQSISSGTCELTLTQASRTITKTSDIALNPSSSTCQGFDVPVSELGSGKWNISIKLSGDGKTGTLTGSASI